MHGLEFEHASNGPEPNCRAALEASDLYVRAFRRSKRERGHDESSLALRQISRCITHVRPPLTYRIVDSPDIYHLDVEFEQKHISVLDNVLLSFGADISLLARVLPSAIGDEGVE